MPLITFVSWLLLVWLAGWLALPFSRRVWSGAQGNLTDAGLAVGRVLLLWMWTLLSFWVGNAGLPTRWSALFIYPLGALCVMLAVRDWSLLRDTVRAHRRGILASEAIFLTVFVLFFVLRGYWPDTLGITGPYGPNGEKGMDMALIAASARADFLPPPNPYTAGARLNSYYYLGHFQTALLTEAISAMPRWTYNLMAATLPALCFSVLAPLCGALTSRIRNGAAAAMLVLAMGTLEPLRQWFFPPEGVERRTWPIDYFSTSRVIPFTINEYPWFTFNFADLHAHYFAMSLVLLIYSLGWALCGHTNNGPTNNSPKPREWKIAGALCGLALGALIVTNTWDFPVHALFIALCLFTPHARRTQRIEKHNATRGARQAIQGARHDVKSRSSRKTSTKSREKPRASTVKPHGRVLTRPFGLLPWGIASVAVVGLALSSAAPFLLRLHTEANRPQLLTQPASPSVAWLLLWGPIAGAWALTLASGTRKRPTTDAVRQRVWLLPGVLALIILFVVWTGLRLLSGKDYFVLLVLIVLTVWTAREALRATDVTDETQDAAYGLLCRLALCGLLALCWSELTWAGFLAPPFHRQDTVFKFGLQAWFLLGTAAVCGALRTASMPATDGTIGNEEKAPSGAAWRRWPFAARLVFLIALPVAMVASLSTTLTRARGFQKFEGWDAWTHLAPPERAAAAWLHHRAHDDVHLIEAEQRQGGDYSEFTRYAHTTGIPTVVGPQAHTFQWGVEWAEVFARKADARAFYTGYKETRNADGAIVGVAISVAERNAILRRYKVRYIVLGELERQEYGAAAVAYLEENLRPVFHAGDAADPHRVTIYSGQMK